MNKLIFWILCIVLLVSTVQAAPSLENISFTTGSGQYTNGEDISLSYDTNGITSSVDWRLENKSIYSIYIPFDSVNVEDITDNSLGVTNTDATYNTSEKKWGASYYFDGNDYMTIMHKNFTTALTVCAWVKPDNYVNYKPIVGNWQGGGVASDDSWLFTFHLNTIKLLTIDEATDNYTTIAYVSTSLDWNYYCAVFEPNYSYLYVNGVKEATTHHNITSLRYNSQNLWIGRFSTIYFEGYIDDLFLDDRVLTDEQILAQYESSPILLDYKMTNLGDNVSVKIVSYNNTEKIILYSDENEIIDFNLEVNNVQLKETSLDDLNLTYDINLSYTYTTDWRKNNISTALMHLSFNDDGITDLSTNGVSVSNFNTDIINGSAYFKGNNEYVSVPYINLSNKNWTICSAFIWNTNPATYTTIMSNWHGAGNPSDSVWLMGFNSNSPQLFVVGGGSSTTTGDALSVGDKHYVCGIIKDGESLSIYQDGDISVTTSLTGLINDVDQEMWIGRYSSVYTNITMNELIIYDSALSESQMDIQYNNYLQNTSVDIISNEEITFGENWSVAVYPTDNNYIYSIPTLSSILEVTSFGIDLSKTNGSLIDLNNPSIQIETDVEATCKYGYNDFNYDIEGILIGTGTSQVINININKDEIKTIFIKCFNQDVESAQVTLMGADGTYTNSIVSLGDSILWGLVHAAEENRTMHLVTDALNDIYGYFGIVEYNKAVSSDCLVNTSVGCQSPIPIIERYQTDVIDYNPRIIVWQSTVNDAAGGGTPPAISKTDYKDAFKIVADDIQLQLPYLDVFLLSTTQPSSQGIGEPLSGYNDVVREYAIENRLPLLEWTYIVNWNQSWYDDTIHFNDYGNIQFYPYVLDAILNQEDYIMTTSDWDYYKYCGLTDGVLLGYNFSSPNMNCYGEDGGFPTGAQDWLIIKNIKESGFIIERADENFTMTTSARYEPNTEYIVVVGSDSNIIESNLDGKFIFEFESQSNTIVSITEYNTGARDGINGVKVAVFAGFGLIAVALLASIAFLITKMFNNGADMASLTSISIMAIGLAIVLFVGYIIISAVAQGLI